MLVIPRASGTQATSRKRIVDPAPQKRLVPKMLKRASGIFNREVMAPPKLRRMTEIERFPRMRAGGSLGMSRLAMAAAA